MRRKSLTAIALILLLMAAILCPLEFGAVFWGNWLHSASFQIGALAALIAIGIVAGVSTKKAVVGAAVFAALFVIYGFLFWTFPGWLLTYKLIHLLFVPGPTPAGM